MPLLKFIAGFLSNILCQTMRSATNLLSCLFFAVIATSNMLLGILRLIGGGRAAGMDSIHRSWRLVCISSCKGAEALLQSLSVVFLVGPLVRASQACSESLVPSGIYAPSDHTRSRIQQILGWNSWEPKKTTTQKNTSQQVQKTSQQVQKTSQQVQKTSQQVQKTKRKYNDPGVQKNDSWDALSHNYLMAKTRKEADRARMSMFMKSPTKYCMLLEAAKSNRPRFKRKSGPLLRAG
jgi:hypothetical protein